MSHAPLVTRRKWQHLTPRERTDIHIRIWAGDTYAQVAAALGCSRKTVQRVCRSTGGVKPRLSVQSSFRLSLAEREEISRGLQAGDSCRAIARRLGRAPSTIAREIAASGGRARYRAWRATTRAAQQRQRPKARKLGTQPRLRAVVAQGLEARWSPQQIAARLRRDFPDDLTMRVSHETIYQSLFVQSRGALRQELSQCLRTGRVQRRPQARMPRMTGHLPQMVMIRDRPAEIAGRAVPGRWEGDLLLGKDGCSAIGTLVERHTRFLLLVPLPLGRRAELVKDALIATMQTLPDQLRRSLTWDQGKEMAAHLDFTIATGIRVYFCDPHSPWQRGSNENSNGLLRQYFPKGTDLSTYSRGQLNTIAAELNARPRQTLQWETPPEVFARLLR